MNMEDLIKDIVVRAGENEIKISEASELVIGGLSITPEMMKEIKDMSGLRGHGRYDRYAHPVELRGLLRGQGHHG